MKKQKKNNCVDKHVVSCSKKTCSCEIKVKVKNLKAMELGKQENRKNRD